VESAFPPCLLFSRQFSMTPEAKVKKQVVAILKEVGAYYFFPPSNGYGRAGIPDVVVCYEGRFIAIECKAGSNQPTALQLREIAAINAAGGIALWVNEKTVATVKNIFTQGEITCN